MNQLKNVERQRMTYELLLKIFSIEILHSLLYRNWSENFFTVLLHTAELARLFALHVTVY